MNWKAVTIALGGVLIGAMGGTLLQAQTPQAPPAFVVIEFTVKDPEGFKDYAQRAPATVTQHGGKFAVRGSRLEALKGDVSKGPFVVLAFDSVEQAKTWASSPEYTALVPARDRTADTRAFIVEGAAP